MWALSTNSSYLGLRGEHPLGDGWKGVFQLETEIDMTMTPSTRAALGSRDSFIGVDGPYGALKVGKIDTPYKRATASFDPFANSVGDYNAIMGNTGGDGRAEFDLRLPHSAWYDSPVWHGLQFSALVSPGQNTDTGSGNFPLGESNCSGSSPWIFGSSGTGTAQEDGSTGGINSCNDGSFKAAYSTSLTYKKGGLTAIAAYELHSTVNRTGDDGATVNGDVTQVGIKNEWAAKGGLQYAFSTGTTVSGIYEKMARNGAIKEFNERQRDGTYFAVTQMLTDKLSASGAWAHAFKSPGDPAFDKNDNSADLFALGGKYAFDNGIQWYLVGAAVRNGSTGHYILGSSGHGIQYNMKDASGTTIPGETEKAISTGMIYSF